MPRLEHAPGDKLFVDYAGMTMPVIDRHTGEIGQAQIFVAALGHSGYTYVEATASQTVPDWLGSHRRALEFLGGVPAAVAPDNLKSGVTRAHRYNPDLNPSYQDLGMHYGFVVLPARAATGPAIADGPDRARQPARPRLLRGADHMLIEPLMTQLATLGLRGMARALERKQATPDARTLGFE